MTSDAVRVDAQALESFVTDLFVAVGMKPDDGRFCASCLVQTNLWGKDSHGVLRVPQYVRRIKAGVVNPTPSPAVVRGGLALEVLDGDNGPGFLVGRDAMLRAIALAEQFNLGAVGAFNSNHFGAAGLYVRLAAECGMIGIAMANSFPKMVAPGGTKAITGSNPIAIAIPTYGAFPFVLDMSLSTVAGGKLLMASERGERIPLDWAVDAQGMPTDDPDKAFLGAYLPMGGVKGLGLSYVVDILSGLVTGGAFGLGMKSLYADPPEPSGTGHMMIALRVEGIMAREELAQRMAQFCRSVWTSPMRAEGAQMLVPGERAYRMEAERRSTGIPLPPKLYGQLFLLGAEVGVTSDLPSLPVA